MKKRRKALDLTQVELAQRIGCAVITVQKIEADRRRPSKQMAELLADQLEIPPADIQSFIRFARLNSHGRAWRDLNEPAGYTSWTLSAGHVNNLPEPLKGLFGRDQDLAEIRKRLLSDGVRLLTLIGPPGVGKTSLAINAAHCLLNEYTDGAFFISLASTIDPTFVAAIIAQFFGVNETPTQSYAQRIKEYLRDKHLLLVLDNFEQVLPASSFLNELLAECLWLSIIVTSRIPLRLRYERQFHVLPLEVPTGLQVRSDLVELTCYPAIALFLERARAARPDFTLTIENAGAIASICARLDGLPLAIEFIAAWVKVLTPQELLELIDGQWTLHIEGLSDASRRHTTLYTAIRWSYDLLSPLEQILLERLGIFSGSWTMDAAQAIMSDKLAQGSLEILNAMSKLVNSSLVVQYEHNGEARFILFEVIRFFSLEQITKKGQENTLRQRHAEYYLALAEEADLHLRSADQLIWLSRLHIESGNLRAALTWFFEFNVNSGIRLAGALGWFWNMCSYVSEGYLWLKKALQSAGSSNPIWRTKLLTAASSLSWQQGDISTMRLFSEDPPKIVPHERRILSRHPQNRIRRPRLQKPARLQALQRGRSRGRQEDARSHPLRLRLLAHDAQPAVRSFRRRAPRERPWDDGTGLDRERAEARRGAASSSCRSSASDYYCFHDRDVAPEGATLAESNDAPRRRGRRAGKGADSSTGIKLLWGTACLFAHPRYSQGAATSPNADVFAYAAAQVKKAMEVTHRLGGEGYTFWGGREGYSTLLNTDMKRELDHLAALPPHGGGLQEEDRLHGPVLHRAEAEGADHAPVRLRRGGLPEFPARVRPRWITSS